MIQRSLLVLLIIMATLPGKGRAGVDCWEMSRLVYQAVPDLIYGDQPDSLLSVLLDWEASCGEAEPVMRLKILAAIWDGAFEEAIYSSRIIDALIWRYDPNRQKKVTGRVDPGLASGDIAGPADFAFGIASFDSFTTDWADQLLPHTSVGTVEEFFCLFYSGKVDLAYEMLHGQDLSGSDLRWYYQREMSFLGQEKARPEVALTGGYWRPHEDLLRVGDHAQWGVLLGVRHDRWLGRLVFEFRPGRTDYPYLVNNDNYEGRSNRFDNFYFGLEVGREVVNYGPHRVDIFGGLGFDGIKPFWEEDLVLGTVNINFGFGYRVFLGRGRSWVAGVDYRLESIGVRNSGGTNLSGDANCLRFSFGYSFDSGEGRRVSGLGH